MKQLFSLESPIMIFLGKMADMIVLNMLFIFCSIPIITIGASATAMCYVTLKARDGYEGSVCKHFFKSFKQNIFQATLIWLFILFLIAVLGVNYDMIRTAEGFSYQIMRIVIYISTLILAMLASYVFFLQSRFHNTVIQTFRNALILAIGNAPRCILVIAIIAAACVITILTENTFWYGLLIWIVVGFSALTKLSCRILCSNIKGLALNNSKK